MFSFSYAILVFAQPAPDPEPPVQISEPPVQTTPLPSVPNVNLNVPLSRYVESLGISPRLGLGWGGVVPLGGQGGVVGGNPEQNLAGALGVRLAAADGVWFATDWRITVGVGLGIRYATLNFRTFRLRWALDNHQNFWAAVSPLDFEGQFASHGALRNRFGWRPTALMGVIVPLGRSTCRLHIFAQGGFSLGTQQTRDASTNGIFQPLLGAEAMVACRSIRVDVQYEHLFGMNFRGDDHPVFNGTDVDRGEIDTEARFRIGTPPAPGAPDNRPLLGPFGNFSLSYERPDAATITNAPRDSAARLDELHMIGQVGARLSW